MGGLFCKEIELQRPRIVNAMQLNTNRMAINRGNSRQHMNICFLKNYEKDFSFRVSIKFLSKVVKQ